MKWSPPVVTWPPMAGRPGEPQAPRFRIRAKRSSNDEPEDAADARQSRRPQVIVQFRYSNATMASSMKRRA